MENRVYRQPYRNEFESPSNTTVAPGARLTTAAGFKSATHTPGLQTEGLTMHMLYMQAIAITVSAMGIEI